MEYLDIFLRITASVIFGGVIGLERERKGRAAGLRTHILVCMGSCLIMLISFKVFDIYKGQTTLDPGRIAAGVVTGIGFLGAGTIIRNPKQVKGLTTAATIWVSAAIGLGVGCGFYFPAFLVTLFSVIILFFFRKLEDVMEKKEFES
jgi:putative Mg2+ transporter-C (MgtC) family protein